MLTLGEIFCADGMNENRKQYEQYIQRTMILVKLLSSKRDLAKIYLHDEF